MNSIISSSNTTPNTSKAPAGFTKRDVDGGWVMDASRQWASRPKDEQVFTIDDLLSRTAEAKRTSVERAGLKWENFEVLPTTRGELALNADGTIARLNNYTLGQLCALPTRDGDAIAPASFLSKLSPQLAADTLNERIQQGIARKADAQLLVQSRSGVPTLRSVTTEAYERLWDHDLGLRVESMMSRGTWQKAEAFRRAGSQDPNPRHAFGAGDPLPLGWVSDRNMFVCLVDYEGSVSHNGSEYARFFLLSNSEVGAGALDVTFGLMDFACCNFILWGCHEVYDASFRHTKSIHERWEALSAGFSRSLSSGERRTITDGIDAARGYLLAEGEAEVIAVAQAATDLPRKLLIDAFKRADATPRYGDPRSVWGMVNGITEASQYASEGFADKRAAIDAKAARLMGLLRRAA